jgi:hypothetical protein
MSKQVLLTVILFYSLVLFIPIAAALLYVRPRLWHYLLALFLGIVVGWWDLGATDVQGIVLLLLVLGLFMGFAQPKQAWRWALLLAMFVPSIAFAAVALGVKTFSANETLGSMIAFLPALIGAYSGALVSRAAGHGANEGSVSNRPEIV